MNSRLNLDMDICIEILYRAILHFKATLKPVINKPNEYILTFKSWELGQLYQQPCNIKIEDGYIDITHEQWL